MARPTKFTPDRTQRIINLVRAGNYRETACAAAGVETKTLRNWLHRAAKGGKANADYVRFSEELDEAEAAAEVLDNNKISKAAEAGDWRASAWRLARRNPERWGERQRIEHTGKDGGPIETKQETGVVVLPPEDSDDAEQRPVESERDREFDAERNREEPEDPATDGAEPEAS